MSPFDICKTINAVQIQKDKILTHFSLLRGTIPLIMQNHAS